MQVTIYKQPDGRQVEVDIPNVYEADEAWFREHNVRISMEDLGDQFAVYAEFDRFTGENELIELSGPMTCKDTLAKLRAQCERALKGE
jgi:hypothetical protein